MTILSNNNSCRGKMGNCLRKSWNNNHETILIGAIMIIALMTTIIIRRITVINVIHKNNNYNKYNLNYTINNYYSNIIYQSCNSKHSQTTPASAFTQNQDSIVNSFNGYDKNNSNMISGSHSNYNHYSDRNHNNNIYC